jgi:hypothetical protein
MEIHTITSTTVIHTQPCRRKRKRSNTNVLNKRTLQNKPKNEEPEVKERHVDVLEDGVPKRDRQQDDNDAWAVLTKNSTDEILTSFENANMHQDHCTLGKRINDQSPGSSTTQNTVRDTEEAAKKSMVYDYATGRVHSLTVEDGRLVINAKPRLPCSKCQAAIAAWQNSGTKNSSAPKSSARAADAPGTAYWGECPTCGSIYRRSNTETELQEMMHPEATSSLWRLSDAHKNVEVFKAMLGDKITVSCGLGHTKCWARDG